MADSFDTPKCPECESEEIKWGEHDQLEGLHHHAMDVKCGECEQLYSVEYEASAVSMFEEEQDGWTTVPIE